MSDYPKNVVWYIEASPRGSTPGDLSKVQMGSAIAVRLRQTANPVIQTFLLPCQHVVRSRASDGELGWGDPLDISSVIIRITVSAIPLSHVPLNLHHFHVGTWRKHCDQPIAIGSF